jgi:predicted Zn-dependent protease with MMP-like domain
MTTQEMITNFKTQLEECVAKIKELDTEMNLKKEEYFKLLGAVQALELTQQQSEETTEE